MTASAEISKHALHRRRLKLKAIEVLGGKCSRCGYGDARALCFRHDTPLRRGRNGLNKRDASSTASHRAIVRGDSAGLSLLCWNCTAIMEAQNTTSSANLKPEATSAASL